jgi:hypothetical protein
VHKPCEETTRSTERARRRRGEQGRVGKAGAPCAPTEARENSQEMWAAFQKVEILKIFVNGPTRARGLCASEAMDGKERGWGVEALHLQRISFNGRIFAYHSPAWRIFSPTRSAGSSLSPPTHSHQLPNHPRECPPWQISEVFDQSRDQQKSHCNRVKSGASSENALRAAFSGKKGLCGGVAARETCLICWNQGAGGSTLASSAIFGACCFVLVGCGEGEAGLGGEVPVPGWFAEPGVIPWRGPAVSRYICPLPSSPRPSQGGCFKGGRLHDAGEPMFSG